MATSLFSDKHGFIEDLKIAGFTEQQAVGLTRALQRTDLNHLATRAGLNELELRLINKLTSRIIAVVGIGVAILALLIQF